MEERKSRIRERRGVGERRLGRRKENRGWRKEEEIRNKAKEWEKRDGLPLAIFIKFNIRRFV